MTTTVTEATKGRLTESNTDSNSGNKPTVAIGIPAYNERGRIGDLVRQVMHQSSSFAGKIILNASGSTDGTQKEVESLSEQYNASSFQIIDKLERAGKAAALDDILRVCSSDIVIFLDGDVKLEANCLEEILKPFSSDASVGVVSGNVMPLRDGKKGIFHFISWAERELHHELCIELANEKKPPKVNGTFFAMKRSIVSGIPHNTVSDDEYISSETQRKGYGVSYAPKALVYTKDPENLKDYIAKRRRIFTGHMLIKKTMGYTVPTTRISNVIPRILKFAAGAGRKPVEIFVMVYLQAVSYALAMLDVARGKIPYRYRVESGKF